VFPEAILWKYSTSNSSNKDVVDAGLELKKVSTGWKEMENGVGEAVSSSHRLNSGFWAKQKW
jgi:hypothetical protein